MDLETNGLRFENVSGAFRQNHLRSFSPVGPSEFQIDRLRFKDQIFKSVALTMRDKSPQALSFQSGPAQYTLSLAQHCSKDHIVHISSPVLWDDIPLIGYEGLFADGPFEGFLSLSGCETPALNGVLNSKSAGLFRYAGPDPFYQTLLDDLPYASFQITVPRTLALKGWRNKQPLSVSVDLPPYRAENLSDFAEFLNAVKTIAD